MAKKPTNRTSKHQRREKEEEFVHIDIFKVPAQQAEMYNVLREAVAEESLEIWGAEFAKAERVSDNPEEGEAVVAYDAEGVEQARLYLNPSNISQAQKARDKDQLAKFLENQL